MTELRDLAAFAETLADASREILGPAGHARPRVEIKADASYVTETDRAIEARLRDMIAGRFPDHGMLGEEFGVTDSDAEHVWVLDPIDGTAPFVAGLPVYGTLIGLARGGKPLLGVIDHPATDDRWIGGRDLGATWNGKAVATRPCPDLGQALLTASSPDYFAPAEWARFRALRAKVQWAIYGGSCYAHGLLAAGRTDLAVDAGLDIFDILAPAAVIEGAGGTVTDWRGAPIDLQWSGQVLAAGTPAVHAQAMVALDTNNEA